MRGEHRVVVSRQRRRENLSVHAERDVAARVLFELGGQPVVEKKSRAQCAENLRLRQEQADRHGDNLQDAVRPRQQADRFFAGERILHGRLTCEQPSGRRRVAGRRHDAAFRIGNEEKVRRVEQRTVFLDVALHGGWIVGAHGGLQRRRVGDEARRNRVRLGARRPQLIDDGAADQNLALQGPLALVRHAAVHDEERDAAREHGQQRAREKNPSAQRGDHRHRSVKSSSSTLPSVTVTDRGSDVTPSFQAMRL